MSVLVTGANRGIGLEIVRQIVQSVPPPRFVFATYRNKDTTQALGKIKESTNRCQVILIKMDVTKEEDVTSMRQTIEKYVGNKGLNLLINNAGVLREIGLSRLTKEDLLYHLNINTIGPVLVFKEMLPLLKKSTSSNDRVLNISKTMVLNVASSFSSMTNLVTLPQKYIEIAISYKASKAALHMVMRNLAFIIKNEDILMINMCPGWVRTDLGSQAADISVEESISAILSTLPTLDQSRHGDFMDRHGKEIPF